MRTFGVLIFLLVIASGCASKTANTNKTKDMQEKKVTNQIGIVDFWEDLGKYTISYSLENTIDGSHTCVVSKTNMIPEALQKPEKKIVFNGTIAKDPSLPVPRMGGEEIFLLLKLESIDSFSNN